MFLFLCQMFLAYRQLRSEWFWCWAINGEWLTKHDKVDMKLECKDRGPKHPYRRASIAGAGDRAIRATCATSASRPSAPSALAGGPTAAIMKG